MSRFLKVIGVTAMSSVYLLQGGACVQLNGGYSILPNIGGTVRGFLPF